MDLQRQFAEQAADIQAMIAQQERMAEASDRLIASLMAQLFDVGPDSTSDERHAIATCLITAKKRLLKVLRAPRR